MTCGDLIFDLSEKRSLQTEPDFVLGESLSNVIFFFRGCLSLLVYELEGGLLTPHHGEGGSDPHRGAGWQTFGAQQFMHKYLHMHRKIPAKGKEMMWRPFDPLFHSACHIISPKSKKSSVSGPMHQFHANLFRSCQSFNSSIALSCCWGSSSYKIWYIKTTFQKFSPCLLHSVILRIIYHLWHFQTSGLTQFNSVPFQPP